jgi:hypothetical protein
MTQKASAQPAQKAVKVAAAVQPAIEAKQPVAVAITPTESKPATAKVPAKKATTKSTVVSKPAVKQADKNDSVAKASQAQKVPAKVAKKAAPASKAEVPKAEKVPKAKKQPVKKPKLVRDSFTIPENDYALFATLKQRALAAGADVKKAELLRAGLAMLAKLDDAELVKAIGLVERIKTGRPKK